MSWSGKNKEEAECSQFKDAPKYEFEIELVSAHPDVSEEYLAESLLMKMCDHLSGLNLVESVACSSQSKKRRIT